MIPLSRSRRSGSRRKLLPNILNGELDAEIFGDAKNNKMNTQYIAMVSLSIGDHNRVDIVKRAVFSKELQRSIIASSNITVGDKNSGRVRLLFAMKDSNVDFDQDVSIGDNNVLNMYVTTTEAVAIGDRNFINGRTEPHDVVIGNDNVLESFDTGLYEGTSVKGFAKKGSLMFETKVTAYAGPNQKFIEVGDTNLIAHGTDIFFGSVNAAYVRREVTEVVGSKVYFEKGLSPKEATFPDAQVFNEYYEVLDAFSSVTSTSVPAGSKRLYVEDDATLHLRKIKINGNFSTKVFFGKQGDSEDENMLIVRDLTPEAYPAGTSVVSDEVNPYREWNTSVVQDIGSRYFIGQTNFASVGRSVTIDAVDFMITGFTEDTITLSSELPAGVDHIVFPALDDAPSGAIFNTVVSSFTEGRIDRVEVDDVSGLFVGQKVRIDGISSLKTIDSIQGNTVIFDSFVFPERLDGRFYIGGYEMPSTRAEAKATITEASANIHTYLFGA